MSGEPECWQFTWLETALGFSFAQLTSSFIPCAPLAFFSASNLAKLFLTLPPLLATPSASNDSDSSLQSSHGSFSSFGSWLQYRLLREVFPKPSAI